MWKVLNEKLKELMPELNRHGRKMRVWAITHSHILNRKENTMNMKKRNRVERLKKENNKKKY
jgi:hypothetical protein